MEKITSPSNSPQKDDHDIPTAGTPQSPSPSERPSAGTFSIQELAKETSEAEIGKKEFKLHTKYTRKQKKPEKVLLKGADEQEAERNPPQGSSQEPPPDLESDAREIDGGEKEAEGEEHGVAAESPSRKTPENEPVLE